MKAGDDSQVEWIVGPRGWWVPFWGPLIVVSPAVGLLTVYSLQALVSSAPAAALYQLLTLVVLVAALGCSLVLRWWLPSVRRLGIAPWGLVFDVGLAKIRYPWRQIYRVRRTRVARRDGSRRTTWVRTRVLAGSELGSKNLVLTLSAPQGDRLAQVLGLE